MKKELTVYGKTVDAAVQSACEQLGVNADQVTYDVIEEPKKGFLGMGAVQACVKVTYVVPAEDIAVSFVKTVLSDMGIDAEIKCGRNDDGDLSIQVVGEEAGALIGFHGETLDTLQFLTNLATNRREPGAPKKEYTRVVLDIEGYRAKREETLRNLARKLASSVKKNNRSVKLEPMSSADRRVIHSEIQKYEGITTFSIGQEPKRRVVVAIDRGNPAPRNEENATEE